MEAVVASEAVSKSSSHIGNKNMLYEVTDFKSDLTFNAVKRL